MNREIESPCVKICEIDHPTQLCRGCGRTMDEIVRWRSLSDEERSRIMNEILPHRKIPPKSPVAGPEGLR